jgi:hypothetical protein
MNAPDTADAVGDLRETVCLLHRELVRWGLVTWDVRQRERSRAGRGSRW